MKTRKPGQVDEGDDYVRLGLDEVAALALQLKDIETKLEQKKLVVCTALQQPSWDAVLRVRGRAVRPQNNGCTSSVSSTAPAVAAPMKKARPQEIVLSGLNETMRQVLLTVHSFVRRKPRSKSEVTSIGKALLAQLGPKAPSPQAVGYVLRILKEWKCVEIANYGVNVRKPDYVLTATGAGLCKALKRRLALQKEAS